MIKIKLSLSDAPQRKAIRLIVAVNHAFRIANKQVKATGRAALYAGPVGAVNPAVD